MGRKGEERREKKGEGCRNRGTRGRIGERGKGYERENGREGGGKGV